MSKLQPSPKDVPSDAIETTKDKVSNEISELKDKRDEVMLRQGAATGAYIKDRVFKYNRDWWNQYKEMRRSDDPTMRKTAFIEYNKLQARILPTQLEAGSGNNVQINIVGMGLDEPIKEVFSAEPIIDAS
jgi:hypothetical protein